MRLGEFDTKGERVLPGRLSVPASDRTVKNIDVVARDEAAGITPVKDTGVKRPVRQLSAIRRGHEYLLPEPGTRREPKAVNLGPSRGRRR